MQEVTETFNKLAESTSLGRFISWQFRLSKVCFKLTLVPRWEKDIQQPLLEGQGQDTGTRSASVSI